MNLTQQLEDKKKELERLWKIRQDNNRQLEWEITHEKIMISQAEIAILEQAIAEMQKQRQEEIDFLNKIYEISEGAEGNIAFRIAELEQLNQPKTDK